MWVRDTYLLLFSELLFAFCVFSYFVCACACVCVCVCVCVGEACWWTIHPASKQRSEGEKVRVGDDLILVSVSSERYLVSSSCVGEHVWGVGGGLTITFLLFLLFFNSFVPLYIPFKWFIPSFSVRQSMNKKKQNSVKFDRIYIERNQSNAAANGIFTYRYAPMDEHLTVTCDTQEPH